jgi:hypothetical protein
VGLILVSISSKTPVKAKDVENDLQQWTVVTLKKDLPHHFKLYIEAQPRTGQNITHIDRLLLRPALGYQLTPSVSLWQGYAWTPTFMNSKHKPDFNSEQRIWQQVLVENHFKHLDMTNRTRLEERFIEGAGNTAVRARHMLRLAYPLGSSEKWSLVGYEEAFVNLNDTRIGPQAGFDQSRTFFGLNRKINRHLNAEAGYMANYVNRHNPTPDKLNHVLLVGLNVQL